MQLLGHGTSVAIWMAQGILEEAKSKVKQWVRARVRPLILVQYLQPPTKDFIRCRVAATGAGETIDDPAPGGMTFESLLDAKKGGQYLFLGSEESVWQVADVRPETSPSGVAYIALELVPLRQEGTASARDARIRGILERMEKGPIQGKLAPYRREDLHARGSR